MQAGKHNALIFPTPDLTPRMLARVSSLFGRTGVCLPWHMDIPVETAEDASLSIYPVFRPLQEQKPPEDFPKLLREYTAWMKDHSDRSVLSFLMAVKRMDDPEDSRWDIQKMVREGSTIDTPGLKKANALRWHLILHLAAQWKREKAEAENALYQSRAQGSPLKEALGEDAHVPDIMGDLSPSFPQPVVEDDLLEAICNAWLGLFGKLIAQQTILVIFEKEILQFLMTRFKDAAPGFDVLQNLSRVCFDMGDPLFYSARETIASRRNAISQQTRSVFSALVTQLLENNVASLGKSASGVSSIKEVFPVVKGSASIHIEMVSLPGKKQLQSSRHFGNLEGFSDKVLVFLTENAKNGEETENGKRRKDPMPGSDH